MTQEADTEKFTMSDEDLRDKILHILRIYPVLSPTMLQSGLGPWIQSKYWRPILDELVESGVVIREQESLMTPTDRYNTYTKLRLADTTVSVAPADE